MKLHGTLLSPFMRMSLVTAIECGLETKVQAVETSAKPDTVNAELEKLSPIGKVPVLETDHGHPVYDSRVIMEYFCHSSGHKNLLPDDGAKHFRILTTLALAIGTGDAAVSLRYEQVSRPETARWPAYADRLRARIRAGLDEFEGSGKLLLQDLTLASIATAVVLSYIEIRHADLEWRAGRPWLAAWHREFSTRESMRKTEPKV